MKNSNLIVLFSFLFLFGCVEKNESNTREDIQDYVFIETDTLSDFYKDIVTIDTSIDPSYRILIDSLGIGAKGELRGINQLDIPKKWVRMIQYKGELYPILYERINGDCLQINDSNIIIPMMEGAWPLNIVSIDTIQEGRYRFNVKEALTSSMQRYGYIEIEILSAREGIAKFFFQKGNEKGYYAIMIDAYKIKRRPLIVIADSLNNRVSTRFNGEPIDMYETRQRLLENR